MKSSASIKQRVLILRNGGDPASVLHFKRDVIDTEEQEMPLWMKLKGRTIIDQRHKQPINSFVGLKTISACPLILFSQVLHVELIHFVHQLLVKERKVLAWL